MNDEYDRDNRHVQQPQADALPTYPGANGESFAAANEAEGILYESFAYRALMAEKFLRRNRGYFLSPTDMKPIADPRADAAQAFEGLAVEALEESRRELMMSLRFLNMALWHMPFRRDDDYATFGTDGTHLYFGIIETLRTYRANPRMVARACLHSIMHCVFRHPFDESHPDGAAWSLACDVSCELTIIEMCGTRFPLEDDAERLNLGRALANRCGGSTPQRLYKLFVRTAVEDDELDETTWQRTHALFSLDRHNRWPRFNESLFGYLAQSGHGVADEMPNIENDDAWGSRGREPDGMGPQSLTGHQTQDADRLDVGDDEPNPSASDEPSPGDANTRERGSAPPDERSELDRQRNEWEEIARKVEVEVRTSSIGSGTTKFVEQLAIANRPPCDYAGFLRRFASMAEDQIVNDEEFDYLFYTLGLSLYGDMPLIEPLEYKEAQRIRDFVIIVDTSESCSGDLVHAFVQRTFDVLRGQRTFASRVNVHIVQCDDEVRNAVKITDTAQLREYLDSFRIVGGGGTDFRPAFAYVDDLLDAGEFDDLKGLLYFTDGRGTYPKHPPAYETCFVFVDDGARSFPVPPWAMRVVMSEDEVRDMANAGNDAFGEQDDDLLDDASFLDRLLPVDGAAFGSDSSASPEWHAEEGSIW